MSMVINVNGRAMDRENPMITYREVIELAGLAFSNEMVVHYHVRSATELREGTLVPDGAPIVIRNGMRFRVVSTGAA